MSTKEIKVLATNTIDLWLPVRFGYEPFTKEDIAFINTRKMPYLYALILQKQEKTIIVLGNASNHAQLRTVVEKDSGKPEKCLPAQVTFSQDLRLDLVVLHHTERVDEQENRKIIHSVAEAFGQESLAQVVTFKYASEQIYYYVPRSRKITRVH